MKKGWEIKKLEEVCLIKPPKSEVRAKLNPSAQVSFVPMENLGINQKELTPIQIRIFSEVEGSYTYFADEDVLLAKITPCFENGKLGIARDLINGLGFGSSEYIVFRPDPILFNEFLYYFLSQESFRIEGAKRMTGAVGHKRVAKEFIKDTKIPIPPLPEQKRIVKTLDKAFAAIDKAKANAEKNLANAKELFESYLNGIFINPGRDWKEKRLGEVCLIRNGGTPKTGSNEYWDGDIHWITPKDMGKLTSRHVYNTSRKISHIGLQKSSAKLLPKNSLILSTRAPIGHLAINKVEMATNQGCRGIIPSKDIVTTYLYYFLSNSIDMLNKLGTGATFKELSTNALSSIFIPIPPLPEQKRIVSKLDALSAETNRLMKIHQQKITVLKELKESILQKAFKGEL